MPAKRKASSETSTATIGFEAKLWLAADKLQNNVVYLPSQLFYSRKIPLCLWFRAKNEPTGKCRAVSELKHAQLHE
jgi:hypothetical protein